MNNFYTTFNELHEQQPCPRRYLYLLTKNLGGFDKYGRDTPIKYSQILEINGLYVTLSALRAKKSDVSEYVLQLFMVGIAYNVLHLFETEYPNDNRIRNLIKIRHLYAYDEATKEELNDVADVAAAGTAGGRCGGMWAGGQAWANGATGAEGAAGAAWAAWAAWTYWAGERHRAVPNEKEFQINLLMEILKDIETNDE